MGATVAFRLCILQCRATLEVLLADFIERYQTLLAAFIAIGGSVYATYPVWKQVALQQRQLHHQARERLAANYRMIADVITLLDGDKWRADVPFGHGPTLTADGTDHTVADQLISALAVRRDRWTAIMSVVRKSLAPAELRLIRPDLDAVDQAFAKAEQMVEILKGFIAERPDFVVQVIAAYNDIIQPTDSVIFFAMAAAREKLAAKQAGIVSDLVGSGPNNYES